MGLFDDDATPRTSALRQEVEAKLDQADGAAAPLRGIERLRRASPSSAGPEDELLAPAIPKPVAASRPSASDVADHGAVLTVDAANRDWVSATAAASEETVTEVVLRCVAHTESVLLASWPPPSGPKRRRRRPRGRATKQIQLRLTSTQRAHLQHLVDTTGLVSLAHLVDEAVTCHRTAGAPA